MEITSINNPLITYAYKLKEKKYRDEENKYLIEGLHLISMTNSIECIFTSDLNYKNDNFEVHYVNEKILKKLSSLKTPSNYIAIVNKKDNAISYDEDAYLLIDNVQDPGNIGTIIRTCLAFNVKNIILEKGSVDIYNEKVIRATQGAIFDINFKYASLKEEIKLLKENRVCIYATSLTDNTIPLNEIEKANKYALIVGNEGNGVAKDIQEEADFNIKIEQSNNIDSLNVAIATGIILYNFSKK